MDSYGPEKCNAEPADCVGCQACEGKTNLHPILQVSGEERRMVGITLGLLAKRHSITEAAVRDIFRCGYENGWNNALQTDKAKVFSRIDNECSN